MLSFSYNNHKFQYTFSGQNIIYFLIVRLAKINTRERERDYQFIIHLSTYLFFLTYSENFCCFYRYKFLLSSSSLLILEKKKIKFLIFGVIGFWYIRNICFRYIFFFKLLFNNFVKNIMVVLFLIVVCLIFNNYWSGIRFQFFESKFMFQTSLN